MLNLLSRIQSICFNELGLSVMPKVNLNRMVQGNFKLDRSILIFDTTAGTCGTCSIDCKGCYAKKSQNRYPMTRLFRAVNTFLAKTNISALETLLTNQIDKTKNIQAVRLHSSGDFFSQEYIDMWDRIIKKYPDIKFYTYTKAYKFDYTGIESNSNFNLINSIIDCDGEKLLNYGDDEHIKKLEKYGCYVCPATIKGNNGKGMCGGTCHYCVTGKKVCFHQH